MLKLAHRTQHIAPFYVMQVAQAARALEASASAHDPRMIYLNIGEPDFTAAPAVQRAAEQAVRQGQTQYTPALGLPALRQRLSQWYAQRWGIDVAPERIAITAGASAALHLACLALVNPGQELLMPDPCYPCNRHILTALGAHARLLPTSAANHYQLQATDVRNAWGPATCGVLLASPANPTGTSVPQPELARIHQVVRAQGGALLLDEIYLGLSFDARTPTGLALGPDVVSINSFSKYFSMTGWRLGWLVLPSELVAPVERLAQNLYICASTVAQHAALACFEPDSLALFEQRRAIYQARSQRFMARLQAMGLAVAAAPDGAFYVWADASAAAQRMGVASSADWVQQLLHECRVIATPSDDFSVQRSGCWVRFSTASADADLDEALQRMERWLAPMQG